VVKIIKLILNIFHVALCLNFATCNGIDRFVDHSPKIKDEKYLLNAFTIAHLRCSKIYLIKDATKRGREREKETKKSSPRE